MLTVSSITEKAVVEQYVVVRVVRDGDKKELIKEYDVPELRSFEDMDKFIAKVLLNHRDEKCFAHVVNRYRLIDTKVDI